MIYKKLVLEFLAFGVVFLTVKKNTTIYVIGTLSNNGKCPKNAFVKDYEANIKINGQTPEIMYIEFNGTSSELENHGIGSLGLDYLKTRTFLTFLLVRFFF